ncbi:MAG: META domain-containing protein [Bosea sp.]|nr:META domain-containing protein [Bosea sp. (in: a-proteobacteria)]
MSRRLLSSRRIALVGMVAAAGLVAAGALAQTRPDPRYSDTNPVPQPRTEKQFPLGASWSAISLNGRPLDGERPTLVIDDQLRAKGFAGCNTFSAAAYPLRDQGFAVGPVAVTRRACPAPAMAAERSFLVSLRGARKWDIVNGQLVLQGVGGELRFERAL